MVGVSGSAGMRFALVTAIGLTRFALMRGIAEGIEAKPKVTSPPASAASAGPPPLNGTWIMSVPVMRFSTSPAR
ncbi:hypothetical protein D3C83_91220 [compost metagenome]